MNEPKSVIEMSADALREMGVLVLVFAPLDFVFSEKPILTGPAVSAIVALGFGFFCFGVFLERKRR